MSKLVQLKRITDGTVWESGGETSIRWAILGKMTILMPFESHFSRFQSHLEKQNF